jgi:hypothetical protein
LRKVAASLAKLLRLSCNQVQLAAAFKQAVDRNSSLSEPLGGRSQILGDRKGSRTLSPASWLSSAAAAAVKDRKGLAASPECPKWWQRFSAGSNHIKGLMCDVGLASVCPARRNNGGLREQRRPARSRRVRSSAASQLTLSRLNLVPLDGTYLRYLSYLRFFSRSAGHVARITLGDGDYPCYPRYPWFVFGCCGGGKRSERTGCWSLSVRSGGGAFRRVRITSRA